MYLFADSVQIVEEEGMPTYKRPFDKGHLLIKFKVEFPQNHFTDEKTLKVKTCIYSFEWKKLSLSVPTANVVYSEIVC
jgi:DnaJ family protein A protein 2